MAQQTANKKARVLGLFWLTEQAREEITAKQLVKNEASPPPYTL